MTHRAYSLVDLLVVFAVLGILMAAVLPRFGSLRTKARVMVCLENCRLIVEAGHVYANDNQMMFPGEVFRGCHVEGNNLFGKTGKQAWGPGVVNAHRRPLTDYLADPWNTSVCPLDDGTTKTGKRLVHEFFGTSYYYFDRERHDFGRTPRKRGLNGVWAIEGHRVNEVAQPDRKLFIADEVIRARHSLDEKRHRWHNGDGPLRVGIGFVDGHVADLPRHEGIGEGEPAWPDPSRVIDDATIDRWSARGDYY